MRRQIVMVFAAAALVVPSASALAHHEEGHSGGGGSNGNGNACPEESQNPEGTPPHCGNQNPGEEAPPTEEPATPAACEGTVANEVFGTEEEAGPISGGLHENEGQFGELAPVVHEVACLIATVDNSFAAADARLVQ